MRARVSVCLAIVALAVTLISSLAAGADGSYRFKLALVGSNILMVGSQTSDLDQDPARNVAYVGSFVDLGVAVVDMTNRARPKVVTILDTHYARAGDRENASDSADVDLHGNLLAVASQPWRLSAFGFGGEGFGGVSLYDVSDPFSPVYRGQVSTGGTHDVQIDPGYPTRPYVYAANFESEDPDHGFRVSIIDASDLAHPRILRDYASPEPQGCENAYGCAPFNSAHDLTLLAMPNGHTILYVAYWDSGFRLVDVTDPRNPEEIGAIDYTPAPGPALAINEASAGGTCCAHYIQPTPSGRYVIAEDEKGIGPAGDLHIYRADGCDGVGTCTLTWISDWSPPGRDVQAAAINAALRTNGSVYPNGIYQRYFTRDIHNLDVKEDQVLAAGYSSGVFLLDIKDKANPTLVAFWQGAANVKDACHGRNTLIPWGYQGDCYFQAREVWAARFGERVPGTASDFYVYVSDYWDGFLVLRTVTSR